MTTQSHRRRASTAELPGDSTTPDVATLLEFLEEIVDLLEEKGILTREEVERALAKRAVGRGAGAKGNGAQAASPQASPAKPKRPFHLRSAPRIQLSCRMMLSSGQVHELGTIRDLSPKGCRVSCSVPIEVGKQLALSLFLPDDPWPLVVNRAEVRWARNNEVGLEFVDIRSSECERLVAFLPTGTDEVSG